MALGALAGVTEEAGRKRGEWRKVYRSPPQNPNCSRVLGARALHGPSG